MGILDITSVRLRTSLVGSPQDLGVARPGRPVRLIREPDNPLDSSAIAVLDEQLVRAGYLSHDVASWVSPLVDRQVLRMEAQAERPALLDLGAHLAAPDLLVGLIPGPRWGDLFLQIEPVDGWAQVIHAAVLSACFASEDIQDPDEIRKVGVRLEEVDDEDLLPETRLLIRLFGAMSWDRSKQLESHVLERTSEILAGLSVGKPVFVGDLTAVPLLTGAQDHPVSLLLSGALLRDGLGLRSVGEDGSRSWRSFSNDGGRPVLVPPAWSMDQAGGLFCQREVRVVAPGGDCVVHPHDLTDQAWSVPLLAAATRPVPIHLPRAAYAPPGLDSVPSNNGLDPLGDRPELPQNTVGLTLLLDGDLLALVLFDQPRILERIWPTVYWSLEAHATSNPLSFWKSPEQDVRRALARISGALKAAPLDSGVGMMLELSPDDTFGEDLSGTGAWVEDRLVFLAVTPARSVLGVADTTLSLPSRSELTRT